MHRKQPHELTRTTPGAHTAHSKCAAAAVWPLPCSLNFCMGPAPATSAWWALGAGAIIRAFPCSALAASVAESWHSNPRPSSYLRATQPTRSDSARAACELGTNRRPPRACPPGSLCITAGIDSNSRRPPPAALPSPARLFCSLAIAALRARYMWRAASLPHSPLIRALTSPCLRTGCASPRLRKASDRAIARSLPLRPARLRSALVHCICCRVRAAPRCAMCVDTARVVRVRYWLVLPVRMLWCDRGLPIYAMHMHDGWTRIDCMFACLQRSEESACACVSMLYHVTFGNTCNT